MPVASTVASQMEPVGHGGMCHTDTLFVVHVAVVEDRHHRTIRAVEEKSSSAIPLRSKLLKR